VQAGKFAASALAAICLTACADPKAASKANFKKALDAYFDQTRAPACIDLRSLDAPFPATLPDQRNELGDSLNNAVQILAMASVGLLTGSPTTIAPRGFTLDKPTPVAATRYDLSELGKKYYQDRVIGGGLGKMTLHQLCFGTPKVVAIDSYTEPADSMGYRISKVSYRYTIQGAAQWTQDASIQKAFPAIAKQLAGEHTETDIFVLTSEGWQHQRLSAR